MCIIEHSDYIDIGIEFASNVAVAQTPHDIGYAAIDLTFDIYGKVVPTQVDISPKSKGIKLEEAKPRFKP